MLKNYLLVALRALRRNKGYSFINIAGLSIGLACCLVIFQYVAFERSYDRFHEHASDLYRVIQAVARGGEEMGAGGAFTPQAMGPALVAAIPEVRRFARVHLNDAVVSRPDHPGRIFEEDQTLYVDPSFLEMFTFPLVAGNPATALEPGTILLSESAAERYFGRENPIGEVLDVAGQTTGGYRVSGVFADVPDNSHLQFELLLPMTNLLREGQYAEEPEDGWSWNNFTTYVQLHPDADRATVDRKMTDVLTAFRGEVNRERGFTMHLYVQPVRDVYLNADVTSFIGRAGSARTVGFFTLIGLVTLLIALVNYVNLATARAIDRAREVGVRKAVGAQRRQLVGQFLAESSITIAIAAVMAVILAATLTPLVNRLAETYLSWALWADPAFWGVFLATLIVATLLAGLYPAFVLSSFRPASVLKGAAGAVGGGLWLRKGLVVGQFAAAVILIGGTAVVYSQLAYMRSIDLGLDLEQVITVPGPRVLPEGSSAVEARATFVEELRRLPGIRAVATSSSLPGQGFNWNGASIWRGENEEVSAISGVVTYIDTSFISLYGLELLAGTGFDATHDAFGATSPSPVLANETAVRALGFAGPEEALDHPLRIGAGTAHDLRIVGVLRDFNWTSAHEERKSILFGRTNGGANISLRATTGDLAGTIAAVERTFTELFPGNVFRYGFADEAFGMQYREDQRFATLFTLFAGLAIAIACLGLLGLAAFTTQRRTKEIGVRKVLGAAVVGLVALVARDFLKLVFVAVILGSPVAYLLMQRWLDDFAYRVDVGPGLFLAVGLLSLFIALLTVAYQSIRAAVADPARSLRTD